MKQLIDLHFRQLGLERLQGCVSPNRRDLTSEIWLLTLFWSNCHCHIKEAAMVTWSSLLFKLWQLQHCCAATLNTFIVSVFYFKVYGLCHMNFQILRLEDSEHVGCDQAETSWTCEEREEYFKSGKFCLKPLLVWVNWKMTGIVWGVFKRLRVFHHFMLKEANHLFGSILVMIRRR